MPLDWDKLRIFHAVAEAGSFTNAGDRLGISQSAVSRHVSALEHRLKVPLFHRHARGLQLTTHGDILFGTTRDFAHKVTGVQQQLVEASDAPAGELRVTTTPAFGMHWLMPRVPEFCERFRDIRPQLIFCNERLDLSMRQADVAIRLERAGQGDLVQRRLFTVTFHVYASQSYLEANVEPRFPKDLDAHRLLVVGGTSSQSLNRINWLLTAGRDGDQGARVPNLVLNSIQALHIAVEGGMGIAVMPDYLAEGSARIRRVLSDFDQSGLEAYFVYPSELRNVRRVQVFRDFLLEKTRGWR